MNCCHASFNHLVLDADGIPPFDEKMSKSGVRPNENSTRDSDGDSITDLDQDTTVGLHIQISMSR